VLFAWPSDGKLLGYASDRDAATYSRDALAQLLTVLARDRGRGDVAVLGHSMGAWLTTESVRQLRMSGRNATLSRLEVVLASPDIDIDVFRAQMRVIGPLNPPMTVLVSTKDKALGFSSRIAGERPRLGLLDVNDPRVQEGARLAKVRLIDLSSVQSPDGFGHDRFVTFARLYTRLNRTQGNANIPGQAGAFVFNSVGSVLAAPFTFVGGALAGQ
jgi:esterase/lipase superfamily enzyme